MQYRPLGKTGKEISVISFGGMRFRPEDYKKDHQICADILHRAQELGVNYIDTAPDYCGDHSEDIVGLAMRQIRGKRPYVSTKCGLWMAKTAQKAYEQVQRSRDRLSVDTIDFYYMWCLMSPKDYQRMVVPGGLYEGLLRAQQDGLIGHICSSVHMDSADMKPIIDDGRSEAILLGYNALNFAFRRKGLTDCHRAGLGTVAMNPLGGGIIPRSGEQFAFLKNSPEESIVHAALRFLIGHKEITAALPGPSTIAELEECVAAADLAHTISEETFAHLAKHLKSELNTLCTSCAYCDKCPIDLPIVKFLDMYNQYLLGEDPKNMPGKLEATWGITPADAAKCTQCGICEPLCTQKLPIMERLKEIASWSCGVN